jgi:hypothetical protein
MSPDRPALVRVRISYEASLRVSPDANFPMLDRLVLSRKCHNDDTENWRGRNSVTSGLKNQAMTWAISVAPRNSAGRVSHPLG